MNVASKLHRANPNSTSKDDKNDEYLSKYIKGYSIWKSLGFWEQNFWERLSKKHRKSVKTSEEKISAAAIDRKLPYVNSELIVELLLSFTADMLTWDVPMESIKKFVVLICVRNNIAETQRNDLLVLLHSRSRSLLSLSLSLFSVFLLISLFYRKK